MTKIFCYTLFLFFTLQAINAQDNRTQYPRLLSNAYFGLNVGYINYPFSNAHVEPGFQAEKIKIPHLAVRLMLLGYRINESLSAQITYMRPVNWVEYQGINGNNSSRSVYMNIAGLTLKSQLPITKKFLAYGEAGLGIITRNGFDVDGKDVVSDESYASVLTGAGIVYRINKKWDLLSGLTFTPQNKSAKQPYTLFASVGFRYNMNPLSSEKATSNAKSGFIFPKHLLQIGYTTNAFGYSVNNFFAKKAHIFWEGDAVVESGLSVRYQKNIFHTRKVFSFDVGTSLSYWKSEKNKENFFTLSLYPLLRFTALRTKPLDAYLFYSVAGPTYISKVIVDDRNTGKHFTFQDLLGLGLYLGKQRNLNFEVNINHYSNGNLFPDNDGIKIPLTFMMGYTFQ